MIPALALSTRFNEPIVTELDRLTIKQNKINTIGLGIINS
jgi:hypothetical protein